MPRSNKRANVDPEISRFQFKSPQSAGRLFGQGEPLMTLAVGLIVGVVIVTAGVHLLAWGIARRLRKAA